MNSSKNHVVYQILIFFSFLNVYAQSPQDLQRLNSEYEKYKNQQTQIEDADLDIDQKTGLPNKANFTPYLPLVELDDTLSRESMFFGYDFFTQRDTATFWENLPSPANYLLGPGDELIISLWGETQLRQTYTISREGKIYDDKVGLLNLAGKTMNEAQQYLKTQYGRVYATLNGKPQSTFIDVSLGGLQSINVNFVGQIKYPGVYPIHPFSTVITGLIQAGGVDTTGSLRQIQIKRNGEIAEIVDLYDYLIKGDLPSNIQLRDQDIVIVPPRKSIITIDSAVVNDGIYEMLPGETVYELIQYAGGQKYNASEMIGIRSVRPKGDRDDGIIFEAKYISLEEARGVLVKNGDQVSVRYILYELQEVELIGQVKSPGKYHYYKGMTFNDLVSLGGGFADSTFWKSVYHDKAEIIRRSSNDRYDEVITVNLNEVILNNIDIKIQNLDRVVIHANSNYFEKQNIQIQGEVNVPGSYPLISDNETLESVINRAGGLTTKAMKNGIGIYRNVKGFHSLAVNSMSSTFLEDESDLALQKSDEGRVPVAWTNLSIPLVPGDSIFVREVVGTVSVFGSVYNPGLIEFRKGKRLKYYIDGAGGMTERGNRKKIIVVYANGVVSPNKWYISPKIESGATIIVNEKEITAPFNPTEFAGTIASFLSSIVTIIVLSKQI